MNFRLSLTLCSPQPRESTGGVGNAEASAGNRAHAATARPRARIHQMSPARLNRAGAPPPHRRACTRGRAHTSRTRAHTRRHTRATTRTNTAATAAAQLRAPATHLVQVGELAAHGFHLARALEPRLEALARHGHGAEAHAPPPLPLLFLRLAIAVRHGATPPRSTASTSTAPAAGWREQHGRHSAGGTSVHYTSHSGYSRSVLRQPGAGAASLSLASDAE